MGRLGIRVGNVALFVLCTFLAANVLNEIAAELLTPARASVRPPTRSEPVADRTWADRKPILDRNLFGAQLAGDAPPPVEPAEDLEETKLPLVFHAREGASMPGITVSEVVASDDPGQLRQLSWLKTATNAFVNALRPRLAARVRDGSSAPPVARPAHPGRRVP